MDPVITNIHSRRNQPKLSLTMANIVYLIRETSHITQRNWLTETGIDSFVKYLIGPICGWVTSKHGSSGKKLKRKQRSFHIQIIDFFLYGEWNKVSRKFSRRFLKRCFYLLKDRVLLFWNKFYPRWCNNIRRLLKIKR